MFKQKKKIITLKSRKNLRALNTSDLILHIINYLLVLQLVMYSPGLGLVCCEH